MTTNVARVTYDAAAREHFDAAPLRFWDRYGERTVARLVGLRAGMHVLDVCSGAGASALPAARAVGPSGSVTAVDVSAPLLDLARQKAEREGLSNIDFVVADMTTRELEDRFAEASFDAIVIVFGIFFAPDMAEQIRTLYRLLRPGGTLAVTTWGPRLFAPLYATFLESVRARHPPNIEEYRPWDRLTTEEQVTALMRTSPFANIHVVAESGVEPLVRAEDWWTIVLGTGLRWFVDPLEPSDAAAVRAESILRARAVRSIETNVIYAVGRK